jgi:hypothetical protein
MGIPASLIFGNTNILANTSLVRFGKLNVDFKVIQFEQNIGKFNMLQIRKSAKRRMLRHGHNKGTELKF